MNICFKAYNIFIALVSAIIFIPCSLALVGSSGDFNKDFYKTWAPTHINSSADGKTISLKLDRESGAAFVSNNMFLFGQFDMQIKLIPGESAGTVVAFYLASDQQNRDEVDFEFLGNVAGQPYTLQTNVYADGYDDREERINLWFDPTKDFHTYSILWNIYQLVFMVDWVPIRVYRNHADKGIAFPMQQPMSIKCSIWNGEDWATRGGQDKIDWSKSPFIASFRNHKIDACVWGRDPGVCAMGSAANWWNQDSFSSLTWRQRRLFKWIRMNYLTYDYCQDSKRFNNSLPLECSLPKY